MLVMTGVVCVVAIGRGFNAKKAGGQPAGQVEPLGIVPGEFERQEALLLAWPLEGTSQPPGQSDDSAICEDRLLCDLVRATWSSIRIVILVQDWRAEDRVRGLLAQAEVPADAVSFIQVAFQSVWIRDYGPMPVRAKDGSCTWIDGDYIGGYLAGIDPHNDRLPSLLGRLLEMRVVRAPIAIEHGNLLSNGRGLCIATQKLVVDNVARGYREQEVTQVLKRFYGAGEVVFLEALEEEPTGHVDMFATFPSPDSVVVAQCSPESDPLNAAILDRNAARLAARSTLHGAVRVVRIPMPRFRRGAKLWPTYTNVVYANDTLLVPVYPGLDPAAESRALAVYRELLPAWRIVGIEALSLLQASGSLHCVTLNLPTIKTIHRASGQGQPPPSFSLD